MTYRILVTLLASFAIASDVRAQTAEESSKPVRPTPVRTYTLQQLGVQSAAKLLAPYLQSPNAGAFEASTSARTLTVRGTAGELKTVDSLLAIFDRPVRTILLRFQLLAPTELKSSDPRIADASTALRELFPAAGYRLVAEGVARTEESRDFTVTVGGDDVLYRVHGTASASAQGGQSLRLSFGLSEVDARLTPFAEKDLLSSTVSFPTGQLIVLGSTVASHHLQRSPDTLSVANGAVGAPRQRIIILVLRPEILVQR